MEEAKIEHLKGLSVINAAKHLMSKYGLNHEEAYKKLLNYEFISNN
jgi:AmiR/NasT family two-component response regulator